MWWLTLLSRPPWQAHLVPLEWLFLVVVVVSVRMILGWCMCYRRLSLRPRCVRFLGATTVADPLVGGC